MKPFPSVFALNCQKMSTYVIKGNKQTISGAMGISSMRQSKGLISLQTPGIEQSFTSLSAIPAQNPIGHGPALKKPCANYCLLNDSSLIMLT